MSSQPLMTAHPDDSTSKLSLGENITGPKALELSPRLTLAIKDKALHIHDSRSESKPKRSTCWPCTTDSPDTKTIDLYNILYAEATESQLDLSYAEPASKTVLKPVNVSYPFDASQKDEVSQWVSTLMAQAYGNALPRKRLKILINPIGGPGAASTLYSKHCAPLLAAARCTLDVETTTYSGHATDIAQSLDLARYDAVVCVSGDGLPHEVYNGLARRPDAAYALSKIAVAQLPGGSGNAMCWNLTGTGAPAPAALAVVKGEVRSIDLISITQGERRVLSFLSQSYGIVAECDLGTEGMRWMGAARFTVGILQRIVGMATWPCEVAVKTVIADKDAIRDHYRQHSSRILDMVYRDAGPVPPPDEPLPPLKFGTVNDPLPGDWELVDQPNMGNFYAGNMAWMSADANFFPASCMREGMFDLITVDGTIPRMRALKMMTGVEDGSHFGQEEVVYRKVVGYRVVPRERKGEEGKGGYVSIDGERIEFKPWQAEVHEGLGRVLAKGGRWCAPGV